MSDVPQSDEEPTVPLEVAEKFVPLIEMFEGDELPEPLKVFLGAMSIRMVRLEEIAHALINLYMLHHFEFDETQIHVGNGVEGDTLEERLDNYTEFLVEVLLTTAASLHAEHHLNTSAAEAARFLRVVGGENIGSDPTDE